MNGCSDNYLLVTRIADKNENKYNISNQEIEMQLSKYQPFDPAR